MSSRTQLKTLRWSLSLWVAVVLRLLSDPVLAQPPVIPFDAPTLVSSTPTCVRAALDLDGDGDMDAISIHLTNTNLVVRGLVNDGLAGFTVGWETTPPLSSFGANFTAFVAVGDFNGDARDDFLLSAASGLGWWLSTGATTVPVLASGYVAPSSIVAVRSADLNADGLDDAIVLDQSTLRVFLSNSGTVPLLAASQPISPVLTTKILLVGDFYAGGTLDIAVAVNDTLTIYEFLTSTTLSTALSFTSLPVITECTAGDIDGDGDTDFVSALAQLGGSQIQRYRRTSPTTYSMDPPIVTAGTLPIARYLIDLDFDGDLDLAGFFNEPQNVMGTACTGNAAGRFGISLNDGSGNFGERRDLESVGALLEAVVADFNGDSLGDLILGRTLRLSKTPHSIVPHTMTSAATFDRPFIDFDRDGDLDLGFGANYPVLSIASASPPPSGVQSTGVNQADGTLISSTAPTPQCPTNRFLGPGIAGDFDGDGDEDLLVEEVSFFFPVFSMAPTQAPVQTWLLTNTGGGDLILGGPATPIGVSMGFFFGSNLTQIGYPSSLTAMVRDVDNDADLDVLLLRRIPLATQIWLNNGLGLFAQGQLLPDCMVREVMEITGDTNPDLVTYGTNTASSIVPGHYIHPGLGGGAFPLIGAPTVTLIGYLSSLGVFGNFAAVPTIADFDNNGLVDFVIPNPAGLTLYRNLGGLTFAATQFLSPSPSILMGVTFAGDFDGDQILDLVSDGGAATIGLYWRGLGSAPYFAAPVEMGLIPTAAADLDSDGDLDLAATKFNTITTVPFTWVENTTHLPPNSGTKRQFGAGLAGTVGFTPLLGSAGILRPGETGAVRISNTLGGAFGIFAIGFSGAQTPMFGGTLYTALDILIPITIPAASSAGAGYLDIPWSLSSSAANLLLFEQVGLADPAAPQGVSLTNGLRIQIGM